MLELTEAFKTLQNSTINFFNPKSIKPLKETTFHKYFWNYYDFIGLQTTHTFQQNLRALFVLFICCAPTLSLLFITVFTSEDDDDQVHGIQIVPVLFLMIFDLVNFMKKLDMIKAFCSKVDEVITRHKDAKFCQQKIRATNMYFLTSVLFLLISTISNMTVMVLTGESGIPVTKFDSFYGIIIVLLAQTMAVGYIGSFFLLLDCFMCSLLFLLSGYGEHLCEDFKTQHVENVKEIVKLHSEFINMVGTYEEIFSTVILLRGLLNVLALSSIVLEIVDKGFSEMSFNVLFFGFNGLFKLFTPCYHGSMIESSSEMFLKNLYETTWLGSKPKDKRNFLQLQTNFMRTLKIKAIKIVQIDLETFVKILQWTYSMYTVLWTLRKNH